MRHVILLAALLCGAAQAAPSCYPVLGGSGDYLNYGRVNACQWWAWKCPDGSTPMLWVSDNWLRNPIKAATVTARVAGVVTLADIDKLWRDLVTDPGTSADTKQCKAAAEAYATSIK